MITRSLQGKILVFVVFLIGIGTGILATTLYETRVGLSASAPQNRGDRSNPQERGRRDQDRLAQYLGLDQTQQDQIRNILEETRNEMRTLRQQTEPQFKAIEDRSRAKIREVLNEEQRRKADEFWQSRSKRDRDRRSSRSTDKEKN